MSLKNRFILFLSIILIEKDIKNYQQLQTSILISNLIILVILGIVIYFLIRRLYFKPFENLKDRLTSSNLDNTFLEEKTIKMRQRQ